MNLFIAKCIINMLSALFAATARRLRREVGVVLWLVAMKRIMEWS